MRWSSGRTVAVVAVAVAVLVGAAFWAGQRFRSPEQAAADAAPPSRSVITVPVELRSLDEPVVLRVRVVPGPSVALTVPPASTGPDSVVTALKVDVGSQVWEGTVLLVRSGEPLIAMQSPFPLYRDLVGGMDGPDVSEVQRFLNRLGYRSPISGTLTADTQSALRHMFEDRGFRPPAGDAAAVDQLPALRAAVENAEQALADLVEQDEQADGDDVAEAQRALDETKAALQRAELRAGPGLPRSSIVRIDQAGRTVTSLGVAVGDVLDDPTKEVLHLDGGRPFLQAYASRDQVDILEVGQEAQVTDEVGGTSLTAVVANVGTELESNTETGEQGFLVTLNFTGDSLPESAEGRSLRVDIAARVGGEEVLAVPLTAIYSRADGTTYVVVAHPSGQVEVTVTTGRTGGGWVEVISSEFDQLSVDDPVVVGISGADSGA